MIEFFQDRILSAIFIVGLMGYFFNRSDSVLYQLSLAADTALRNRWGL